MSLVENRTTFMIIVALVMAFIILLSARVLMAPTDKVPVGDALWEVTVLTSLKNDDQQHNVRIATPLDTEHARIISQKFVHPGMRMTRLKSRSPDSSDIVLRTLDKGQLVFEAEYIIQTSNVHRWLAKQSHPLKDATQRQYYLRSEQDIESDSEVVLKVLAQLSAGVTDTGELVNNIFKHVNNRIITSNKASNDNAEYVLATHRGSALGKAHAMVAICRSANLPARVVTGIVLNESLDIPLHYWVEVYLDDRWFAFDPVNGYADGLPPGFLPLKYSSEPLATGSDALDIQTEITVLPAIGAARLLRSEKMRWFDVLDLTRLSVAMQEALGALLMLPFGALLTVIFRQLLGLRTYGTFTPALLALAVIHAEWITMIFILLSVLAFAVSGRALLGNHMSRIPRLTVIFTLVALSMGFAISAMDYLELSPGPHVVLLPIIILTGLIDHIYRAAEDAGLRVSMLRLLWTSVVGFLCYGLFRIDYLSLWTLMHPEIHLLTVASAVTMSLYRGKKLTDFPPLDRLCEPRGKNHGKEKESKGKPQKQPVSLEP